MPTIEPNRNVYVGHRYVPLILGEWSQTETYEGLSIVTNQGDSYTSKKRVPIGIPITNGEYWVLTGNYNAQIDQYRQDVNNFKEDVDVHMAQTVKGAVNRPMKFLGGAIQPTLGTWDYITETFHAPMNFGSISQQIDRIRVNYDFLVNKVTSLIATPDETFIKYGLKTGTSVGDTYADIKLYAPLSCQIVGRTTVSKTQSFFSPVLVLSNVANTGFKLDHPHTSIDDVPVVSNVKGYDARITSYTDRSITVEAFSSFAGTVAYNGTSWTLTTDNVTPVSFSFDQGNLTVTHDSMLNMNDLHITGRGGVLIPSLGVISNTQFIVQFRDYAGVLITTPTTDMKFFYGSGQKVKCIYPTDMEVVIKRGDCIVIPANVNIDAANIWLLGAHEVTP